MPFLFGSFSDLLQQSEYLHVLLNPIPIYGLATGALALALGFAMRSRPARMAALIVVCLTAACAWPAYHYGEESYDRMESMADHDGDAWLNEHQARAEKLIVVFYALAGLALAAVVISLVWPRGETVMSSATLLLALATLGAGGWIAFAGGHIRHKEFRNGPPPVQQKAKTEQ